MLQLKVLHKLLLLAILPLVFITILVTQLLISKFEENEILSHMADNVLVIENTSKLIGALQAERGKTAIFMASAQGQGEVISSQNSTDEILRKWLQVLPQEKIKNREAVKALNNFSQTLKGIRGEFSTANPDFKNKAISDYSGLLKKLFQLENAAVNSPTTRGLGKMMSSILILESAKEAAGKLRANGSVLFARNTALSEDELFSIVTLQATVNANLSSPALLLDKKQKEQLQEFEKSTEWSAVNTAIKELITLSTQGEFTTNSQSFWNSSTTQMDNISSFVTELLNQLNHKGLEFKKDSATEIQGMIFGLVIFLAVLVLTLVIVIRSILKPINQTISMLKNIAEGEGDLTLRLSVAYKDEFGEMAKWFNVFIEKIQNIVSSVIEKAHNISASSEEQIALTTSIYENTEDNRLQTNSVNLATQNASNRVTDIASASESMNHDVQHIANSMQEMTKALNEISRNCSLELKAAENANKSVLHAKDIMSRLESSASSVGEIVDAINDIAEQTNLLALNATIEAATAGEAGKGFAVVASEVKQLAQQTAQATDLIAKQIKAMQNDTQNAYTAIETIFNVVEEVNQVSQNIVAAVEEQSATIQQITHSVELTNSNSSAIKSKVHDTLSEFKDISTSISKIHSDLQITVNSSETISTKSQGLAATSVDLNELVNKFKVSHNAESNSMALQITKGIAAHSMWKSRILNAIKTGQSTFKPEIVKLDDRCDFGKWLKNLSAEDIKKIPDFNEILRRHAKFHEEAGEVLFMAINNKQKEAKLALKPNQPFSKLSSELINQLSAIRNNMQSKNA